MKRILSILLISLSPYAWGQDFASRFMEQYQEKEELKCQTIGPKMMERLMDMPETVEDKDDVTKGYFLSKLKSARIVTTDKHGRKYFDQARLLIEKNRNRFMPLTEGATGKNNLIFVRRHDGLIRELVMLNYNQTEEVLTVINFTGEMDDSFIRRLSKEKKKED